MTRIFQTIHDGIRGFFTKKRNVVSLGTGHKTSKVEGSAIDLFESGFLNSPFDTRNSTSENCWALFGDIHANLEALKAVLTDIKKQGVLQVACTGDIVGYAANPSECLKIVRNLNCPVVMGNHDFYASTKERVDDFNLNAMNAILWTREQLSKEEKTWLSNLSKSVELRRASNDGIANSTTKFAPNERKGEEVNIPQIVHSTIIEPERWCYILAVEKAEEALRRQEPKIVFFGHTHVPSLFSFNPTTKEFKYKLPLPEGLHQLENGWKHLINPGSVGQPRDKNSRASYAVFNEAKMTIQICRIEYDITTAQEKIKAVGLPVRNAERLSLGR